MMGFPSCSRVADDPFLERPWLCLHPVCLLQCDRLASPGSSPAPCAADMETGTIIQSGTLVLFRVELETKAIRRFGLVSIVSYL